jgi:uncharacterized damage-inducible protein DinB
MTPEFFAGLRSFILQGFAPEMATALKVFRAIPDTNPDYRPDPKSKTALELAWHIASVDVWFLEGIAAHNFDPGEKHMPDTIKSGADLADWYEPALKDGLAKVEAMTPEQLATNVNFYGMFNMPAAAYLQFFNNHHIHHRGQLSTYLRAMGGKCPSIYGGSADEPMGA